MTTQQPANNKLFLSIILMVASAHMVNDLIQSMLMATYPLLEQKFSLSMLQIGCISLVYQITASILQPAIGFYTDKHPKPYLLPAGMAITTLGIVMLALASHFYMLLISAALLGVGSSTFHPEASRVARNASGGKFGLAQSSFQVGGNFGSALGPLLASFIVLRHSHQEYILWFVIIGLVGIVLLSNISNWAAKHLRANKNKALIKITPPLSKQQTKLALSLLCLLIFSKYFYMAGMTTYYGTYLTKKFDLSVFQSGIFLSVFLASVAAGTFMGGPIGDRIGRKYVIWFSILGATPFTLALPYSNLVWTIIFSICIGLILSSAFAAIVVYAQELMPNNIGMISGVFFGLMFGMSGIAAALLGYIADKTSLQFVFQCTGFFPLLGIFTIFLPNIEKHINKNVNYFKK